MNKKKDTSHAIRIAAHEWHAQIQAGDMTAADRQRFDAWLADDARHEAAYERARFLWQEVGSLDNETIPSAAFEPLPRERFLAWCRVGLGRWSLRLAGGALAAVTMTFLVLQIIPDGYFSPGTHHFETAVAEIRDITLPDGTEVTLGGKTHLSVDIESNTRRVFLNAGEAFFDVAKDPQRPFVILSEDTEVQVIGTAFDLRRFGDGLRVAVAEGRVQVSNQASNGRSAAVQLTAGQQLVVNADGTLGQVMSIDPAKIGAWRNSRLVYMGAPLSQVVADANRYFDGWILLRDQKSAELKITAAFDARDINAMLTTLDEGLPIDVWRPLDAIAVIGSSSAN